MNSTLEKIGATAEEIAQAAAKNPPALEQQVKEHIRHRGKVSLVALVAKYGLTRLHTRSIVQFLKTRGYPIAVQPGRGRTEDFVWKG